AQETYVPFGEYCVVIPRDRVHLQAAANPFAPTVERVHDHLRTFRGLVRYLSRPEEDRLAGAALRQVPGGGPDVGHTHAFQPAQEGRVSVAAIVATLARRFRPRRHAGQA